VKKHNVIVDALKGAVKMGAYFSEDWLKSTSEAGLRTKKSEIEAKIDWEANITWFDLHETYANEFCALDLIEEELMLRPLNGQMNVIRNDGQVTVSVNRDLLADIYAVIKDWPDIISNEENLKQIASLNMCNAEQIVNMTNAIYAMFSIARKAEEGKEGVIKFLP